MNIRIASFVAALAVVVTAAAVPASAADLKIGYIVTPRLLGESELGKEASAKLKTKAEAAEKGLAKKMEQVQKLQEDISKRMAVLNEEEKIKLGEEFERQLRDAKRAKEDAQRDFDRERKKIEDEMMEKFRNIIEKFATENGFDMVLDATTLLYISEKADVTEEVIKLADKSF